MTRWHENMQKGNVMIMEDCIFCKIANGEIPSRTIYEDEKFRVIMDMSPAADGHSLVLPKEHYADLYEMPEALLGEAYQLAQKMAKKMTLALQCDGFNVVQNNGTYAGQTVFHFHVHLIPRYQEDGQDINWRPQTKTSEELDKVFEKLK